MKHFNSNTIVVKGEKNGNTWFAWETTISDKDGNFISKSLQFARGESATTIQTEDAVDYAKKD